MEDPILVEGLSVSYERKRVLTNIYLRIERGQIYGVIGPNGAGKSTLFKAILGLVDIASGKVQVNGTTIEKQRKEVAYIPQKDDVDWQFPATVGDIVRMGRYPHKKLLQRLSQEDERIIDQAMEELGILNLKDRQIGALSG